MAYNGSVELISGITPKNNGEFPLVDAKDVYVDDDTRLDDALTGLKDDLQTAISVEIIQFTHGAYIATAGSTANINSPTPNTDYSYAVVTCSEGDSFTINVTGGTYPRAFAFISDDGTVLNKSNSDETLTNTVITAPAGTKYLVLNNNGNGGVSYKGIGNESIKKDISIHSKTFRNIISLKNYFDKNSSDNVRGQYYNGIRLSINQSDSFMTTHPMDLLAGDYAIYHFSNYGSNHTIVCLDKNGVPETAITYDIVEGNIGKFTLANSTTIVANARYEHIEDMFVYPWDKWNGEYIPYKEGYVLEEESIPSIDIEKIKQLESSNRINLFNKYDSRNEFEAYYNSNGTIQHASNFKNRCYISHPIYLTPGTYSYNRSQDIYGSNHTVAIVNENGEFIKSITSTPNENTETFTIENECFVRLNLAASQLSIQMVCKADSLPETYYPYENEYELKNVSTQFAGAVDVENVYNLDETIRTNIEHKFNKYKRNYFNKSSEDNTFGEYWTLTPSNDSVYKRFTTDTQWGTSHQIDLYPGKYVTRYDNGYNTAFPIPIIDKRLNIATDFIMPTRDGDYWKFELTKISTIQINIDTNTINSQFVCREEEWDGEYIEYDETDCKVTKEQTTFFKCIKSPNLYDKNKGATYGQYYKDSTTGLPWLNTDQDEIYGTVEPFLLEAGTYIANIPTTTYGSNLPIPIIEDGAVVGKCTVERINSTQIRFIVENQCYITFNITAAWLDSLMVCLEAEWPNTYVEHGERWEIPELSYTLNEDNLKELPSNILYGKKIAFDGDSICQAGSEGNHTTISKRGWAGRIISSNAMIGTNYGIGGGTITAETYRSDGPARHWISRNIDDIHTEYQELDYLILEGGTNDADVLKTSMDTKLGTLDIADYSGNYDDTTFTGALDSLFYKAVNYYPYTKIGFIIAMKMGVTSIGYDSEHNNRRFFFQRAMDVCKKWGIPYINLWDESPLNPSLKIYYDNTLDTEGNIESGKLYVDGQHLTPKGYDTITTRIESWIRSL